MMMHSRADTSEKMHIIEYTHRHFFEVAVNHGFRALIPTNQNQSSLKNIYYSSDTYIVNNVFFAKSVIIVKNC